MNRWEDRAKTSREDLRWSRTVEAEVEGVEVATQEKIPLLDE